jgi:hypothetical protein
MLNRLSVAMCVVAIAAGIALSWADEGSAAALASANGVVKVKSTYGFDETITRLKADIAKKNIMFFIAIDQARRGSDYGIMAGPFGVEFTITIEPRVAPSLGMHLCFRAADRLSGPSMPQRSPPAAWTMERRDCATYITPTTSLPTFLP